MHELKLFIGDISVDINRMHIPKFRSQIKQAFLSGTEWLRYSCKMRGMLYPVWSCHLVYVLFWIEVPELPSGRLHVRKLYQVGVIRKAEMTRYIVNLIIASMTLSAVHGL